MKKFISSGLIMLCFLSYAYTQQRVNCYTDNSNLWTGSVSKVLFSYQVTDDELIVGNPFQSRAWAKFNLTGIPDNATIDNVEIDLFVYQASSTPSSHELVLSSLYVDPVTASGNTLWNSIDDPPDYLEESTWGDADGQKFKSNLTTMINDIQSSLIKNWFAVGFYERIEDAGACYIIGHLTANAPYLVINFSLPAPSGVSATDGTYCDRVRISWNAVTNADRYYIYRGTTSLGYTSNLYFDYSGASTSPEEYRVYAAKSSIDNRFSSKFGSDSGYKKSPPTQPGQITGSSSVCQGTTNTYSISSVSGATTYTWSLPSGWSGSSTSTSISATAGANAGTISVTANNSCGSSTSRSWKVTVHKVPSQPAVIIGSTSVCPGSTQEYTIVDVAGATSYTWTLPSGWSGSSTSTSITATAGASDGTISVTANNSCGSSTSRTLSVTVTKVPSQPAVIVGSASVCMGSAQEYLIYPVSGATSYTWTVPSGWDAFNTTQQVIGVVPGFNSGTISVIATNSCGSSIPRTLYVTVLPSPDKPGAITGSTSVCQGTTNTYSISPVSGATSYTWALPSGWSGSSTSSSITATAGASGGYIYVSAKSSCYSLPTALSVSIASKPTITTSSVSTLSSTTATGGGNITSNGGAEVTVSGVCWGTSSHPTTSDSKTTDGTATGSFKSTITGLSENVKYYIRAYATNCSGTSYGSNVEYNSSNAVEFIQSSEISVYPNPVIDILNIEYKNSTYHSISIINPQGIILKTEKVISSQQQLDFSKYEPGLYILEIVKSGGGIERVRVIKH